MCLIDRLNPRVQYIMKTLIFLMICIVSTAAHSERLLDPMPRTMTAHQFELPDISGKYHKLSDYQGKFVLVNFWATSCTICRAELTTLEDMLDILDDDNLLEVLTIHAGNDLQGVEELMQISPVSYPMLMDMDLTMGNWGIPTLPTSYLVTPDGMFAYRVLGTRIWNSPNMIDFLHEIFDDYYANQ